MSGSPDEDKQHEPSQKRLDEARKQGQVPRSQDLTTAAVYGAFLATLLVTGRWLMSNLSNPSVYLLEHLPRMQAGPARPAEGTIRAVFGHTSLVLAALVLPMCGAALGSILAQRGLVFAPEKIRPRLSRISPIANAGQKFGLDGLVEFAKSTIKMVAISAILVWQVYRHSTDIGQMLYTDPMLSMLAVGRLLTDFLMVVTVFMVAVGVIDLLWQRLRHLQRNRMSYQEVLEEAKDSEGDPHMKGHRRRRGQELALSTMLADVAKADVVIVNPTHYAVALRWKRTDLHAPICLAKGVDDVAARIRERAGLAGIPLHSDPPTARALHATVEVGKAIRPEQYKAVAAAIRFAEKMRQKKAKGRP